MNDTAWRIVRTLAQGATAVSLITAYQAFSPWPMTPAQIDAIGPLVTVLLTVVVTTAQNTAEAAGVIPTIGKPAPAPLPPAAPGPADTHVSGAT